jgi:hypothetical protein
MEMLTAMSTWIIAIVAVAGWRRRRRMERAVTRLDAFTDFQPADAQTDCDHDLLTAAECPVCKPFRRNPEDRR